MSLRRQGNLLHPPGRGRQHRAAGRVLPVRRLQPVDRPRGGSARRPSAASATPTSSAPTVPAAGEFADGRRARARRGGRVAARAARAAASWSAPAASRCCSSIAPLLDALHAARLRGRGGDQRHGRAAARDRLALREPQGGGRRWWSAAATSSSWSTRRRGRAGAVRGARLPATSSSSRWTGRPARPTPRAALRYCLDHPRWRLSLQTHKLLGIP